MRGLEWGTQRRLAARVACWPCGGITHLAGLGAWGEGCCPLKPKEGLNGGPRTLVEDPTSEYWSLLLDGYAGDFDVPVADVTYFDSHSRRLRIWH